jgi:hypothetical protein
MNSISKSYYTILEELKAKIRLTRRQAILNLNNDLLNIYWLIGAAILQQQSE